MNNQVTLKKITNQINRPEFPIPFNEASKLLDISKSYLYKLTHQNKITYFKPNGKKIFFLKTDLVNWLTRNRIASDRELEAEETEGSEKDND